jgi:hypothetical protein
VRRRRAPHGPAYAAPFGEYTAPNAIWCADFKGGFALSAGAGVIHDAADGYSRYLLRCEGLTRMDDRVVRPVTESAFAEFGRRRDSHGQRAPFATVAAGGISRLAIWWIKLGIRPGG